MDGSGTGVWSSNSSGPLRMGPGGAPAMRASWGHKNNRGTFRTVVILASCTLWLRAALAMFSVLWAFFDVPVRFCVRR